MIHSILDTDQYKLSMQQAVLQLFPNAEVEYRFTNRGSQKFTNNFLKKLREAIKLLADIKLKDNELEWLKQNCPYFTTQYLAYLKNYRFNPKEVQCSLSHSDTGICGENDLVLSINGPWHSTILWEVPLMAIISELYFNEHDGWDISNQYTRASEKGKRLADAGCLLADFGTRRRRSNLVQQSIIMALVDHCPTFVGTSNMHFAMLHNLKPIGTMAHEWVMGDSVSEGLRNANYYALQNWVRVYNSDLGIALTDTYGLSSFLDNFNIRMSRLYNGVRHDSGSPFVFTDRIIDHYKKMGIDSMSKTIVFSDGLNVDRAIKIQEYCQNKLAPFPRHNNLQNSYFRDSIQRLSFGPFQIRIS